MKVEIKIEITLCKRGPEMRGGEGKRKAEQSNEKKKRNKRRIEVLTFVKNDIHFLHEIGA